MTRHQFVRSRSRTATAAINSPTHQAMAARGGSLPRSTVKMPASRHGAIALPDLLASESRNGIAAIDICTTFMVAGCFASVGLRSRKRSLRAGACRAGFRRCALGRAAAIAMVAALVVQIRSVRLSRPTRVADDLDGRHGRLRSVLGGNQSRRFRAAFIPFGRNRVSGRFRRRTPRRNIFRSPIVGCDGGDTSFGRAQRKSTR